MPAGQSTPRGRELRRSQVNLTILQQEENAKVFAFGPFGQGEDTHEVVCCLRSHPNHADELEIDVVPVPSAWVGDWLLTLWNLPDDPLHTQADPFGHANPPILEDIQDHWISLSMESMPGNRLAIFNDIQGRPHVPAWTEATGGRTLYPLPADSMPELTVYCLTGQAHEFLGRITSIMRSEKGLNQAECPVINDEAVHQLASLLETGHSQQFRQAAALLDGCPDEKTTTTVSWYASDQKMGWRRQAGQEFPLLAGLLATEPETRDAIDCARPLLPALKNIFPHLTKSGLKRLGQIERQEVAQASVCGRDVLAAPTIMGHRHDRQFALTGEWQIREAVRDLTAVGNPSIIPATTEEWKAFATLYAGLIRPLHITLGIEPCQGMRASKGHWQKLQGQLGATLELDDNQPLDRYQALILAADMLEMCSQLSRTVILPGMIALVHQRAPGHTLRLPHNGWDFRPDLGRVAFKVARDILLDDGKRNPLLHCCQLIRRWTPRINALNNILAEHEPAMETQDVAGSDEKIKNWQKNRNSAEALTDTFVLNDVFFTPLHTTRELEAEGRRMRHCIATYDRRLRDGDSVFYHLQQDDQQATLCLDPEWQPGRREYLFYRNGFNGVRNAKPNRILENAATRLINGLNDGQVTIRPEFHPWREWVQENKRSRIGKDSLGQFADYCGYPREELQLSNINPDHGLHDLTGSLWTEWREITKCRSHPFKLIAHHPAAPWQLMLRDGLPSGIHDEIRASIQETGEFLGHIPAPVKLNQQRQPAII